jgi:uncharacterized membrane protein
MNRLKSLANWKTIVPLTIIFLVFVTYLFPRYEAEIYEAAGEEVTILDVTLGYTVDDVQTFFAVMGTEGGEIYRFLSGRIDMIYPVVYALLLFFIIISLTKRFKNSKWMLLSLIPIVAAIFDFVENISIAELQLQFPNLSSSKVAFASTMTSLKWGSVFLAVFCVITLSLIQLVYRFQVKSKKKV